MKKAFSTFLAIMYLMSGVGFGSVHHFCHHEDKIISPDENHCCSTGVNSENSLVMQNTGEQLADSCCDITITTMPAMISGTAVPGDCCEIQHKFNQLDNSSLQMNIDVSQATEVRGELSYFPQNLQVFDRFNLITFTDQQAHINLPLLI